MKKIFGFIGSPLKEKSNTYTLTRMMIEELQKIDGEITFEILTAGHVKVNYCKGCWACMTKGFCPQDKNDDMGELKRKMMEADFIIFGSPVYTMSVSGQMKTFLDRLCAWYHLMKLAGRAGMTVATTAGGGLKEVHDLQSMLMCALGVKIVTALDTHGYFPKTLADENKARQSAKKAAEEVYPYISGEKKIETDSDLEEVFTAMKNKVTYGSKWLPADYEYWQKNRMLECKSFADILKIAHRVST